ncbi:MAG: CotH kinase family protein [Ruminococcus sp.]
MLKKAKSAVSIVLSVMMIISCFAFADFSVSAEEYKTVYFNNNEGWEEVYCFLWNDSGVNAKWPGEKMEQLDSTIWSYTVTFDAVNIIFGNGGSGEGNQTEDLILPGDGYLYDSATNEWSVYNSAPKISSNIINGCEFKDTMNVTITALAGESSYYTINDSDRVDFTDNAEFTLGSDTDSPKEYTIKVYSENSLGNAEKTFVYKKINTTTNTVESTAVPYFAESGSLYAHAQSNSESTQAWQEWEFLWGPNSSVGVRYFFLPPTASDSEVELYNSFDNSVIINGVEIKPNTSAIVSYKTGERYTALVVDSSTSAYVEFYKSDSEVSLYINDTTGVYTDSYGNTVKTDFYSFLIANKENAVNGAQCTIIDDSGINDTTLKKIKGRGNSTWRDSNKKPFNINFDSKTSIGGISSKKFSLLANAKDGTLLRNRIMYDFANEVGSSYSPDSRSVDLYINGVYKGAYQITQKVELGKNSLVSLKDESDTLTEDFNFLIEVDIWNYAGDVYFESDRGIHVVCKTPDLEGYDGVDETLNAQYNFMKSKYQQLEDALYSGNMADLEAICDVDSLARAYLLQEFSKNCDGGMTSCYFTYVAADGKFIADPIWDCDSGLGNVACTRQNATNTAYTAGWAIRTAQYDETEMTNILGQSFSVEGTTANGETFEEVVKRLWNDDFIPAIAVLKGEASATGTKLKSVEEYRNISPNSSYLNYYMWKYQWFPYFETLGGTYSRDLDGQINYMYDWLVEREKWMTKTINNIFEVPEDNYYLTGVGFGGWGAKKYMLTKAENGSYTIDVTLLKDTEYIFKIFNEDGTKYFTADLNDETTAKYLSYESSNYNAAITPSEDLDVTIIFTGNSFILRLIENKPGDVNLDGVVNVADATEIQKHLASLVTLTDKQLALADIDGDGYVSIQDATKIQRISAGLD